MNHTVFQGSSEEPSFTAIGGSFTEGLSDTVPDGGFRGWAGQVVTSLGARNGAGFLTRAG